MLYNNSHLISIIVPVYNVEQYLENCIESLIKQTYSNLEIVLVNDGSTDKSKEICDYYVTKDIRIKCIHKKNEGSSKARQIGVANSSGDWLLFVDSDDKIPNNAVEILFQASKKNSDIDIVIGGYKYIPQSKYQQFYQNECISGEELIIRYLKGCIHTGPVAKLFRKSIIKNEDFNIPRNIKMGEDEIMNIRFAQRASNVMITDNNVYFYYIRPSSICQTFFWTFSYARLFEKILYASLDENFKTSHKQVILLDKWNRRIVILKSFVKKSLKKFNLI